MESTLSYRNLIFPTLLDNDVILVLMYSKKKKKKMHYLTEKVLAKIRPSSFRRTVTSLEIFERF